MINNTRIYKDAVMKRSIAALIAFLLLLPAISYAGSVTSKYDVTIGGFVKFDMGYATQGVGADYKYALRSSYRGNQNQGDEYGNFYSAAGESRLNIKIKGPDGWGAKTSAFIEGDFRGSQGGANYGVFALRHAYIKFDWKNTSLIMGQTWQRWGYVGSHSGINLGVDDVSPFLRGSRQPQITVEQRFNRNWSASLGLYSPTNSLGTTSGATQVDSFTNSGLPFAEGEIVFKSDACGKIGPRNLLFGLGGYIGQDNRTWISQAAATGTPQRYSNDKVTSWGIAFKGYIPIIPEKQGNKTGAFSLAGNIFMGQDLSWFATAYPGAYPVGTADSRHYSSPLIFGGFGQLQYYFTDKLFITGWYGYGSAKLSTPYTQVAGNVNSRSVVQHIVANLSYDVNPAVRFGIEYANIYTSFANYQPVVAGSQYYDSKGSFNTVRIGAWYFF